MNRISVLVNGAYGNMGREVIRAVLAEQNLELVAAVDMQGAGADVGELTGCGPIGVRISQNLEDAFGKTKPRVAVDFTTPMTVMENISAMARHGICAVVGTSGIGEEDVETIRSWAESYRTGIIIAPNFALGAVLMMAFAEKAARYMPAAEIIELHHDQKIDAPSGTAMRTAERIRNLRKQDGHTPGRPEEMETLTGARGGNYRGIRVHSVRLPGLVAHQEVIFGGLGQILTLRHDSLNRQSFMPGVILAINRVVELEGLVYGLEHLLDL